MMFVKKKEHEALLKEHENLKLLRDEQDRKYDKLLEKFNRQESKLDEERSIAFKTMELDFKDKMNTEIQKLKDRHRLEIDVIKTEAQEKLNRGIEENFTKLKDSLAKLHEEGNANTKYLEKMSISIMENFAKSQRNALGYVDNSAKVSKGN